MTAERIRQLKAGDRLKLYRAGGRHMLFSRFLFRDDPLLAGLSSLKYDEQGRAMNLVGYGYLVAVTDLEGGKEQGFTTQNFE